MKLRDLLEQLTVELNVPKSEDAYKFDKIASKDLGYGTYYKYAYTNVKGDPMEVTVMSTKKPKDPGHTLYVAFGPDETAQGTKTDFIPDPGNEDPDEEEKYNIKTGAGDVLKVLATVVQAVKNTANKIGGMDKVYAMAWSPADKKRKNVYDHYVQTLFPSFKKDLQTSSSSFQHYINQDFKGKEVNEIGGKDEKMEPYRFKTLFDEEDYRTYVFKTDSGLDYQVDLGEIEDDEYGMVLNIEFGVTDEEELTGPIQNLVTNKGELYRVMNTIAAIIREDLAINSYIKYITFNPAKRDKDVDSNARGKLYMKYIQGRIPNAKEVQSDRFPILIKIK